jgi:hypothetical protein
MEVLPDELILAIASTLEYRGGNVCVLAATCRRLYHLIHGVIRASVARIDRQLALAHEWQQMCPGKIAVFGAAAFWQHTGRLPILVPSHVCVLYLGDPGDDVPGPRGGSAPACSEMLNVNSYWFDMCFSVFHGIPFFRSHRCAVPLALRLYQLSPSYFCFGYTDSTCPIRYHSVFDANMVFDGTVIFSQQVEPSQRSIYSLLQKCRFNVYIRVD